MEEEQGASTEADRAVVNGAGQAVSALRASVPSAAAIAFALPLTTEPTDADWAIGDEACALLDCVNTDGELAAAQLVRDYRAVAEFMNVTMSATPYSFEWRDGDLGARAIELIRSMAAVKCKNKYPVGVIGAAARAHYTEARRIAQAIETRRAETERLGAEHESAVPNGDAPTPPSPPQGTTHDQR